MIESSSNIPITPKTTLNATRSRADRAESSRARETTEDSDSFEPSSQLAARTTGETPNAVNLNTEQEDGGAAGGERESITSSDEAGEVVSLAREQILDNNGNASRAQGNLDRDRVLDLIA